MIALTQFTHQRTAMTTTETDQTAIHEQAQALQHQLTRLTIDANAWCAGFIAKTGKTSLNLVTGAAVKVGGESFIQRAAMKAARLWALSEFDSYRNELDQKVREWRTATQDINRFLAQHGQDRVDITAPVTHTPDRGTAYGNDAWLDAASNAFQGLTDAFDHVQKAFDLMEARLAAVE